jgi:hypothetical protein
MIGLLALGLARVAATPIPLTFRGEWQVAKSQCGTEQEDMLNVSDRGLQFYEARFAPGKIEAIRNSGLSMRGRWHEDGGDGDAQATVSLTLSNDRNQMTVKSPWWTSKLVRCS